MGSRVPGLLFDNSGPEQSWCVAPMGKILSLLAVQILWPPRGLPRVKCFCGHCFHLKEPLRFHVAGCRLWPCPAREAGAAEAGCDQPGRVPRRILTAKSMRQTG